MKLALSKNGKYLNEDTIRNLVSSGISEQDIVLNEEDGKVYMYFSKAVVGDIRPDDNPITGWWILDTTLVFGDIVKVVPNDYDFIAENDEDYSTILNWDNIIARRKADYKMARKEIKNLFFAEAGMSLENWDTIVPIHREIAAKYFIVPKAFRDTIYSTSEQYELGEKFHREAVNCRNTRAIRVLTIVRTLLSSEDADEVIDDINETYEKIDGRRFARNLLSTYIDLGREGTSSGNPTGIYDYFECTGGFDGSSSIGFLNKGYIPVGGTIQELVDEIMDVFRNGIIN